MRLPFLLAAAAIAAAAGAAVFISFNHDLAAARRTLAAGDARTIASPAGPIEYAERGAAGGIPLLSIHGAGGGWDQGLANVGDLVGAGFRVIAPSRFGYLGTAIPADTSSAAQADAHAALLAALGVRQTIVVGVSAGARSALDLALRHPDLVTALILISPGTYSPDSPVQVDQSPTSQAVLRMVNAGGDFAWWAAEKVWPSALIRFIGVNPEVVAQASLAERERVAAIVKAIEPLSMRFPGIDIDSNPDLGPLPLNEITVPTLLISARDDLFNTLPAAQYAAARIPRAKLVIYDTGGHLLVGHEQDTRALVTGFLEDAGLIPDVAPASSRAMD
jgi:pimeloyl-ACP methyl ester carboxylesterase